MRSYSIALIVLLGLLAKTSIAAFKYCGCQDAPDKTNCENTVAADGRVFGTCYWDDTNSKCADRTCASYGTGNADCKAANGCFDDDTDCVDMTECTHYAADACSMDGCIVDSAACVSATGKACTASTDATSCSAASTVLGCFWTVDANHADGGTCAEVSQASECESFLTSPSCNRNTKCLWTVDTNDAVTGGACGLIGSGTLSCAHFNADQCTDISADSQCGVIEGVCAAWSACGDGANTAAECLAQKGCMDDGTNCVAIATGCTEVPKNHQSTYCPDTKKGPCIVDTGDDTKCADNPCEFDTEATCNDTTSCIYGDSCTVCTSSITPGSAAHIIASIMFAIIALIF